MAGLLLLSSALRCAIGTAFTCTFTLLNNSVAREGRGRMQVPAAHGDDAHTLHMHAHIYIYICMVHGHLLCRVSP